MSFEINETSERFIGSTRDNENRTTLDVSRTFQLVAQAASNPFAARQALAFAGVFSGSRHPQNPFMFCDRVQVNQISPIFFEATASYGSPAFSETQNPSGEPVLERPDVRFSASSTTEPIDTTVDELAIATATGELYQGLTKKISDLVITIKRNYAIFDPNSFYDFINTTNSDTFMSFAPGRCFLDDIQAVPQEQDNYFFWEVTVKIIVRKPFETTAARAWQLRLRHQGYYCFIERGPDDVVVRAIDANGEPTAQPVPLDEDGFQQESGDPPEWKFFQIYDASTFAQMNLGV